MPRWSTGARDSDSARVVFPISVPGILTVVIFSFSLVVNEFVYAFTFISPSEQGWSRPASTPI